MSSNPTKQLRRGPTFFEAETRIVDIDAHLTTIKSAYSDDFSGIITNVAPEGTEPPDDERDMRAFPSVTNDDDIRTRYAKGSNPPTTLDAAMTARMPASVAALLPPPPAAVAPPMSRIEPTQVRLINPDNQHDTAPTRIHVADLAAKVIASLEAEAELSGPALSKRDVNDTLPPLLKHPPIAPHIIDPTEIKVYEAADSKVKDATELRPMTQPEGPYCPVGAPQLAAYQIVSKLAVGGMGIVYDAFHRASGHRVAVKYMRRVAAEKPELVQRFLAEAVAASRIDHPGVAAIYDYGHDDAGVPYLVMEYLEGESLAERLSRGPLSPDEFMAVSRQIAMILTAAHASGIIHRDLKPDNIFMLAGDVPRVKVLDFGVAKFQDNDLFMRATKTGQMLGTPYYMSPEQCSGQSVDRRSDVYALGCVMYQMLTGRVPFSGNLIAVVTGHRKGTPTPIPALNSTIPNHLVHLVNTMLAKQPEGRPQAMSDVVRSLDEIAALPPEPPRDPSSPSMSSMSSMSSGSRSGSRVKLSETVDSLVPGVNDDHVRAVRRRSVRIGFPLALLLASAIAVSAWLMFVVA